MKILDQSSGLDLAKISKKTTVKRDGNIQPATGWMAAEHFIDIYINEKLAARLVCTPEHLAEMVVGRLISDGYIRDIDEIKMLYICEHSSRAKVFLHEDPDLHDVISLEPTCCTGNHIFMGTLKKHEPEILEKGFWKSEWVFAVAEMMADGSELHEMTRGAHSCYLGVGGDIAFSCDDIGRHNALDKAIGWAALHGYDRKNCILYTTGRVPADMMKKAIFSRIPVLVSKATPTDAAVELAKRYNMTLICNAWPDQYEIFHEQS